MLDCERWIIATVLLFIVPGYTTKFKKIKSRKILTTMIIFKIDSHISIIKYLLKINIAWNSFFFRYSKWKKTNIIFYRDINANIYKTALNLGIKLKVVTWISSFSYKFEIYKMYETSDIQVLCLDKNKNIQKIILKLKVSYV